MQGEMASAAIVVSFECAQASYQRSLVGEEHCFFASSDEGTRSRESKKSPAPFTAAAKKCFQHVSKGNTPTSTDLYPLPTQWSCLHNTIRNNNPARREARPVQKRHTANKKRNPACASSKPDQRTLLGNTPHPETGQSNHACARARAEGSAWPGKTRQQKLHRRQRTPVRHHLCGRT